MRLLDHRGNPMPKLRNQAPSSKGLGFISDAEVSALFQGTYNPLLAALVNLYTNVLSSYKMQERLSPTQLRDRQNIGMEVGLMENPTGNEWVSYIDWIRTIVFQLLKYGRVVFRSTDKGFLLGTTEGYTSNKPDYIGFRAYPNMLVENQETTTVPVKEIGIIGIVDTTGRPQPLIAPSVQEVMKTYQEILAKFQVKLENEPNVGVFIETDYSSANPDTTQMSLGKVDDNTDEDDENDLDGKIGRIVDGNVVASQSLAIIDRRYADTLSAHLTVVLNALSIPKEVFNVHISHTGAVAGEVFAQFIDFAIKPIANIIAEGFNSFYRRNGENRVFFWDIRASDWQADLYKAKVVKPENVLTRDELRERQYRMPPAPEDAVFAGQSATSGGDNEEEDADRDRSDRTRGEEIEEN